MDAKEKLKGEILLDKVLRLFCIMLSALLICALCGCGAESGYLQKDKEAFQDTIDALFDALDRKDAEGVYALFSPEVRAKDTNLQEQITCLLSVYSGPTEEIGWDGLLAGGASHEHGAISKNACTTFPVRSADGYYWCYLDLMYENNTNKRTIGITQLDFYTAEEYCIFRYSDEKQSESVGLQVHADQTLDAEVRCISGWPHQYNSAIKPLKLEDVKRFLENSNDFAAFQEVFGKPNAEHIYSYYALLEENGKPRYLEISTFHGVISSVSIVDHFEWLEKIYGA